MVSCGSIRRVVGAFGVAAWILALSAASAMAAGPQDCEVQVSPRAAPAGSVFVFTGSGLRPTELTLQKQGAEPVSHDLDVGDSGEWEVTTRSRIGDEGTWTANFIDPALTCTASVTFRVTLSSTDLMDDIAAATSTAATPWSLYLAVVAIGFASGMLMGRMRTWARA